MRIRDHIINRLEMSLLSLQPFPHLYMTGVFPEDVYWEMLERWPAIGDMTVFKGGVVSGHPRRYWNMLYGDDGSSGGAKRIEDLRPEDQPFWRKFADELASEEVKAAIFNRFSVSLEECRHHNVRLMTDVEGYMISRHPDSITKVLSMLFYCPGDGSKRYWGTEHDGGVMPFLPNTMFAFARTDDSFHWVNPIRGPEERRQVLVVYER